MFSGQDSRCKRAGHSDQWPFHVISPLPMLPVAPCWSDTYSISYTYRRHLAFLVYTSWTFRFTTCFSQDSEPVLSSLIFVSSWTPNQLSPCRCNRAVHLRIAKQASHGAELWSRMEVLHDGRETKEICVSNILESLSILVFKIMFIMSIGLRYQRPLGIIYLAAFEAPQTFHFQTQN